MRPFIIISALYFGYVSAQAQAQAQCFDAGDCILSGGGQCNKAAGQLLGTCQKDGAAATGGKPAPAPSASAGGLDALLGGLLAGGAKPSSAAPAATTKRP
ncbi:hypothetical protein J7T55_011553 [Diaporthe amygdali]|uniref:uncharacterized protein n=1 Tax=Phomopsis amygdali TaxID=1214568 RepID=UPI0022FE0419|nr:uncharacterized protein J7T55_011553 [Diaporthe amygdali]KAJ0123089.1 hypothetical protein J7T55_011553 [Diaporthe amygdali]